MYFVYKIFATFKSGEKNYVGSTSDITGRIESHKESKRFSTALDFKYEVLLTTYRIGECLEREWLEIDIALGGKKPDGNREHFNGSCLNRTTTASMPISSTHHLCYTRYKGYFIKEGT